MLEPRQGGDICSLAGLTWPHVIIPATMSSLQYRHGAPPRHGAMCRGPPSGGFYPVGGFLSEPCQYIPCPLLPTTWSCVFIACHNIKKCNKHYNTQAQPLFCSLNLLFSDVPIAIAIVVFMNSLIARSLKVQTFEVNKLFVINYGFLLCFCRPIICPWALRENNSLELANQICTLYPLQILPYNNSR